MSLSQQGRGQVLQSPVGTWASQALNRVIVILGYILHSYVGDLSWDLPAVRISAALGAEAMSGRQSVPGCSDHLSLSGVGRGGKRDLPNSWGRWCKNSWMVSEEEWTFVAEVRKDMWWRTENNKPPPWLRGQVLFTRSVLERHHDFEIGIQVLSELTSISASSCHFQSREIRINWTAARQALESHKWFVRAFSLGGHYVRERI